MAPHAALHVDFPASDAEIPTAFRLSHREEQTEYLVGGRLRRWTGPTQTVHSPLGYVSGDRWLPRSIGHYPCLDEATSMGALEAAARAWGDGAGEWPAAPLRARIECVRDFTQRMQALRDEVSRLLVWEIAKTQTDAWKEFDRTVAYIEASVEALLRLDRASAQWVTTEGVTGQVRRAPLGVTLCMGPFNYPLNETFTTLIPALLMGNPVVFKPPKLGVLLHRPLLEAFASSFPPGVVNTVYGDGETVIAPMLRSGDVDVLAFIGTSRVADILKRQHPAPHRLRCVLGLEAKNPAIVLPDADLEATVAECALGALSYNGQRCTALKILFVHSSVRDAFVERLTAVVEALPRGMPWDEGVIVTPLAEPGKPSMLRALVDDACANGARLRGGGRVEGSFFHPAVVDGVRPGMRLFTEEQFGPVIPVVEFDELEEPMRYVRESEYGQQASLFGRDPDQVGRLVRALANQVCRINVNSQCQRGPDTFPFTGRKASAEGTLSVTEALEAFSIPTMLAAKETPVNRRLLQRLS